MLVTRFGAAGVLLPVLVVAVGGLCWSRQYAAVRAWLPSLALAVVVTLVSKLLFFGWGIGSTFFDFTGVSGHTLLATSILPVFANWLLVAEARCISVAGVLSGAALAIAVGVSRVILGAHSWSEVVAAWALGGVVSALALQAMRSRGSRRPWLARFAPLLLLFALMPGSPSYLPTHAWEVDLSRWLSGRERPYTREHLRREAAGHPAAAV